MKKLIIIFSLLAPLVSYAQNSTIAYSRDFEFKEGVYLTIYDFINNNPIASDKIVTKIPKNDLEFLHQVTENKYFVYTDGFGKELKVETATVWGYCQNRSIYLNYNNTFNRLNVIGTLCHFTAQITTYTNFSDPMYNMGMNRMNNTYDELRQFILNTQTNKIVAFNVANMDAILKNDTELHNEFMKIKKRKRDDAIFVYLRKYNDKHPLYLNSN